jgi:primosomal protein N' (replication factor Y) (superfamily II helicase)
VTDAAGEVFVDVAVSLPLHETFTYRDPRGIRPALGTQVVVPFGARMVTGFVVGHRDRAGGEVRDIEEVVGESPAIDEEILELCRWAAAYYLAPLGEVLRAALPQAERVEAARRLRLTDAGRRLLAREAGGEYGFASLSLDEADRALLRRLAKVRSLSARPRGRPDPEGAARTARLLAAGLVEIGDEVRGRRAVARTAPVPSSDPDHSGVPPVLNAHQAEAFAALAAALTASPDHAGPGRSATFLLQGITGSGKTEVYLRLIAEARQRGRGALVLVPEIALTPQLAARFRARFGDDVAVLHSGLAPGERRAAWRRLRAGEVGIALGVRSAVFAPVRALGVVVVDEEHDGSFKQEDGVRYHGRDLAVVRAQKAGAVAVLGSATPSLESYRNVLIGRFRRLTLPMRANPAAAARPLPPVEILDLRRHPPDPDGLLSPPLAQAMTAALDAGDQIILFLNRRGFSPLMLCRACGHVLRCPHCAVSMTYHRGRDRLVCHYCARTDAVPASCPSCRRPALEGLGMGTEQVESMISARFPAARVARLDRDTADDGRGGALERLLRKVHAREVDVLVGTQMVTKGHDFAGVTLVGVLQPDQGMHLPDFRAAERTFQLLEQVAGRAGRGERPGRVIVQTYSPDHPAIECLRSHDYEGFVAGELARRREAQYPPFSRMIAIRVDGPSETQVRAAATDAAGRARAAASASVRVLGPAEAPLARLRGRSRWQVWLSGPDRASVAAVARAAGEATLARQVRLAIDVDPQSVL